jgi:hypothetical protein
MNVQKLGAFNHVNGKNESKMSSRLKCNHLLSSISRLYEDYDACASYDVYYDQLYDDLLDVFFCGVNRAQCFSIIL